MRILDISRALGVSTPAWPGDAPLEISWTALHDSGAAVSRLTLSPHLATHLDAPLHLDADGGDAATVPLARCLGACQVVRLDGLQRPARPDDLPAGWSPDTPRILFASGSWPTGGALPERFAALSPHLVDHLADRGVVLIGVDTPSVDAADADGLPAHRRCLQRSVTILEGLDLEGIEAGLYTLIALPLRLVGGEASPVRAVLLSGFAI
ncbi:MAG: cyclase family protein [Acidobacteriota bacterium]